MIDIQKTGRLIAESRKSKNLTQRELASKLGVTNSAVSKWERGLSLPDVGILEGLSGILGISIAELIRGERFLDTEETVIRMETVRLVADTVKMEKEVHAAKKEAEGKIRVYFSLLGFVGIALLAIFNPAIVGRGGYIFTFVLGYMLYHPFALLAGVVFSVMLIIGLVQKKQAKRLRK